MATLEKISLKQAPVYNNDYYEPHGRRVRKRFMLRRGELLSLQWDQVVNDFTYPWDKTKTASLRQIPLMRQPWKFWKSRADSIT